MPSAPRTLRPPGAPARHEQRRRYDRERAAREEWRRWYGLAIWCGPSGIRARQLAAQPLCERCLKEEPPRATPATVVDHVGGHRGEWARFVGGPFESLCKDHHDREAQAEEARARREDRRG